MSENRPRRIARRLRPRNERGFTLIELLVVVAIIGILAAMALALFANTQSRARTAKAQADTRTLASALTMYMGHCGAYPPSGAEGAGGQCNGSGLSSLTVPQTTPGGQTLGPFLATVPTQPLGWTPYTAGYAANVGNGTFLITTSGDGYVVTAP